MNQAEVLIMESLAFKTFGDSHGFREPGDTKNRVCLAMAPVGYPGGIKEHSPALGEALRWVRQFLIPTLKGLNRGGKHVSNGFRYTAANVRFKNTLIPYLGKWNPWLRGYSTRSGLEIDLIVTVPSVAAVAATLGYAIRTPPECAPRWGQGIV